jgi:hypothetical protein
MQKLAIVLSFLLTGFISNAQFYKSFIPSPAFTDSLNAVVTDFKNNFKNIQGAPVNLLEDADVYRAVNSIPGAIESFVIRYHSVDDTSASFQAVVYDGEDYKEAEKIYKNLFKMMNKTRLKMEQFSTGFEGKIKNPEESSGFTISQLKATSSSATYKDFIAEVELINEMYNWKVRLNLHNKKADDLF